MRDEHRGVSVQKHTVVNFLTVDVEEWFHVHAFSDVIHAEDWNSFESRVERNVCTILDLFDNAALKSPYTHSSEFKPHRATFFILGWIAERYPALVREIQSRGHEIASHGYIHQCIFNQTQEEFREDVKKAKLILESILGEEVIGYRAPTFSIMKKTLWALNILGEVGYKYDSSVFPILHDYYGMPSAPSFPFLWNLDSIEAKIREIGELDITIQSAQPSYLVEFPMSTVRLFRRNFPAAGGGYFRIYPYVIAKFLMRKINRKNKPFIFYFHPWEIDPDIPKIKGTSKISQLRTYLNLHKAENRLRRLLSEFHFSSISGVFYNIKHQLESKRLHHTNSY